MLCSQTCEECTPTYMKLDQLNEIIPPICTKCSFKYHGLVKE